jgi:lytic murein transglycosylase B
VQAVLEHIRRGDYSYTLEPGPYGDAGGGNAIDGFWLDRRQGFCEHYAASFVFIMRVLRVPARIVTGYQGSDPAPVDGYQVVRQSHAHAWAEIWTAAAVAPDRVSASRALAPTPGFVVGALANVNPAFAAQLRTLWEAMNNRWNQTVLNYSRGTQFELLKSLGVRSPSWADLAYALAALIAAAGIAGALWAWWDRVHQDPWLRLQRRVQQRLAALQVEVAAHQAPRARASAVRRALGERGETLAAELDALDRMRYATSQRPTRAAERAWWRRFEAHCGALAVRALLVIGVACGLFAADAEAATQRRAARTVKQPAAEPPSLVARHPRAIAAFATQFSIQHDLPREWVDAQLAEARLAPAVQKAVLPPPAGTPKNWAAYRARFIEPKRIAAGVAFWREQRRWLDAARARWGVPPQIVAAIIGVETFYGGVMGNFRVVDALATLAFEFPPGRRDRSDFFRSELEELLLLSRREGVAASSWKGSYAGAIGWPQFMPGSINRWAVDFDEDGHVDLQRNVADAIGSVAHYLAWFGWRSDLPTHYDVLPPEDPAQRAMLLAPDIVPSFTPAQFEQAGAKLASQALQHDGLLALVELHNGHAAPSFVAGTSNFYVITRYNWSSYYAMAVIELAAALQRAMEAGGG